MLRAQEQFRIKIGPMATDSSYGANGCFDLGRFQLNADLYIFVILSDGLGWEHASVSIQSKTGKVIERCPTWEEMCKVKETFWDDTDCVVQYHPPKSDYVNHHKYCLHLWRSTEKIMPRPDPALVGGGPSKK